MLSALTDNNPEALYSTVSSQHDTEIQQLTRYALFLCRINNNLSRAITHTLLNHVVLPEKQKRRNCAVSFEALSKWSNYLSVLVEAEDMSPWTGTTEEPSSRTRYMLILMCS